MPPLHLRCSSLRRPLLTLNSSSPTRPRFTRLSSFLKNWTAQWASASKNSCKSCKSGPRQSTIRLFRSSKKAMIQSSAVGSPYLRLNGGNPSGTSAKFLASSPPGLRSHGPPTWRQDSKEETGLEITANNGTHTGKPDVRHSRQQPTTFHMTRKSATRSAEGGQGSDECHIEGLGSKRFRIVRLSTRRMMIQDLNRIRVQSLSPHPCHLDRLIQFNRWLMSMGLVWLHHHPKSPCE